MARTTPLAKRSLVVDLPVLQEWTKLGRYRTESEAVRAAVAQALAAQQMQAAMTRLQRRGTFGRRLR